MRPTGSGEELERRRHRALTLLKAGLMPVEVARQVGVDRRSVRRWKAAVNAQGERALKARPTPGRPMKLSPSQRVRLERWLLKGAQAAGFTTDLWTCPRVAELIARRLKVYYHVNHVGRLLRGLGWSPQKPARRAIERDEVAIRQWLKTEWPRVKKTPPAAVRRSSSATKRAS
ncbi:MAG TPA: winged helix-turn-helix domain-containing protein [Gammaproteobacteria bacterium]|nr:winged helix-turn-helix domain-containing protein [Gammaproteobacteria bacterium]